MNQFTYRESTAKPTRQAEFKVCSVLLDSRLIGHICRNARGYVYVPKGGSKFRGETFQTINEVKRSVEAE
jgi:hypothetical protein